MSLLFTHEENDTPISIPPNVQLKKPARYASEAMETKRLRAIAYLGDKWVLAATRQDFIAQVQGLV